MLIGVLLGVAGALVLSFYFSGIETALYSASQVRLRIQADAGDARARLSHAAARSLRGAITTVLIGNNLGNYLGTYLLTSHLAAVGFRTPELLATAILLPLFFLLGESFPKRLAHLRANGYLREGVYILRISGILLHPLSILLGGVGSLLHRIIIHLGLRPPPDTGRARLAENLEASRADGLLTEAQLHMTRRIMELDALTVRDAMLPAHDAFTIPESVTCREAARRILRAHHHRAMLADEQGSLTGRLVTLNALLRREDGSPEDSVLTAALPTPAFPLSLPLATALHRMRRESIRLALVCNAAGNPVGIISMNRILGRVVVGMQV